MEFKVNGSYPGSNGCWLLLTFFPHAGHQRVAPQVCYPKKTASSWVAFTAVSQKTLAEELLLSSLHCSRKMCQHPAPVPRLQQCRAHPELELQQLRDLCGLISLNSRAHGFGWLLSYRSSKSSDGSWRQRATQEEEPGLPVLGSPGHCKDFTSVLHRQVPKAETAMAACVRGLSSSFIAVRYPGLSGFVSRPRPQPRHRRVARWSWPYVSGLWGFRHWDRGSYCLDETPGVKPQTLFLSAVLWLPCRGWAVEFYPRYGLGLLAFPGTLRVCFKPPKLLGFREVSPVKGPRRTSRRSFGDCWSLGSLAAPWYFSAYTASGGSGCWRGCLALGLLALLGGLCVCACLPWKGCTSP